MAGVFAERVVEVAATSEDLVLTYLYVHRLCKFYVGARLNFLNLDFPFGLDQVKLSSKSNSTTYVDNQSTALLW